MKVLYDHQIFQYQSVGGISRYFIEIIDLLKNRADFEYSLSVKFSNNIYLKDFCKQEGIILDKIQTIDDFLFGLNFKGKGRLFNLFNHQEYYSKNELYSLKCLSDADFDIFHPTYYHEYYLDLLQGKKLVVTVHDMIHELYPEYFEKNDLTAQYKKLSVERADHLVAISENTKKDLIKFYNISPQKISVVYHASSLANLLIDYSQSALYPEKYILFVGGRGKYKNFGVVLQAFANVYENFPELKLICAGGGKFTPTEKDQISKLGITEAVIQKEADDSVLVNLYKNSTMFVYPSLYEGFGMPVLEAMQIGCPVISSNASSLPEVGGDAVLYFDPTSVEELGNQMVNLLMDNELKNKMVDKAKIEAKKFSWEKSAEQMFQIYSKLLK